jgi:hypothetical protein
VWLDEFCGGQDIKVKGKSWSWQMKTVGNRPCGETFWDMPNEEPKDAQARLLR